MTGRDVLGRMWVLMFTVFVDMIGFLIVLPLLPFYAEKLGADPTRVGALVSTFAVAQLASAPLWGRLSDRYGRRPMILAGLLLSAIAYVVFESASAVWLLFLSRFVQGAGGGTVGVVQAYVSDVVGKGNRAEALGWLTAATSAGVMIGPALGSLAAAKGWIGPGYLAATLCVLNFLFGLRWLPESQSRREGETKPKAPPGATREVFREVLRRPSSGVGGPILVYAAGMMAFMAMNGILALYLERVFGVTEATIGWFFVYVGGVSLLMRTLVLGPTVRRLGEVRTLRLGALAIGIGMAASPLADGFVTLGLAVIFIPIGTALLFPVTTSLVSHRSGEGRTGMVLGVQQTFGGVSRMLGPLWAGAVFQHLGIRSPFWIAAGLMLAVFVFSHTLKDDAPASDAGVELDAAVPTEPS